MATEKEILRMLDLLTTAEKPHIESLAPSGARHVKSLRRKTTGADNVVALGISEKISGGKPTGELALTFYVEKKLPLSKLTNSTALPMVLPESLTGNSNVITDVVEIGKIRLQHAKAGQKIKSKVIQPGNSIGHINVGAGTLGALVTKGKSTFFLSNSHVLANSGMGQIGDAIVYPGIVDGGVDPRDVVANLHHFHPFDFSGTYTNHADCAIAKPTKEQLKNVIAAIKGIGIPKGPVLAKRGMEVVKVGRTTNKTTSKVKDVNFRVIVEYPGIGDVGFLDQVFCERFTDDGDSGALVMDKSTRRAVGLHFAGANGGSVFNPIHKVLECLKVKLVTK